MKGASAIGAGGTLALMTLYFFTMGYTVITPSLSEMAEAFPDQPYLLINSIPTLFLGITGLVFGAVAGRRLSFRTLAVTGSLLCLVGGCLPAFIGGFGFVLFCRVVFGTGLGLLVPMSNALVNLNFEGDRRSYLLGVGSLVMNVGGVVLQMLGGCLAEIGWRYVFLGYAPYVVALAMSFLIRSVPVSDRDSDGDGFSLRAIAAPTILMFVFGILQYTIMASTSEYYVDRGFGGPAASGTALSMFTVGGVVGGVCFGRLMRLSHRTVMPLVVVTYVVGPLMMVAAPSSAVAVAALTLMGFGFGLIIPASMEWAGMSSTASSVSKATSVVTAVLYLGDFASTAWMEALEVFFGDSAVPNMWVTAVVCAVMLILFLLRSPFAERASGRGNRF